MTPFDTFGPGPSKVPRLEGGSSELAYNDNSKTRNHVQMCRNKLPICLVRSQLVAEIERHPTCIVIGETGCGKTTQLPQFLYECHIHGSGIIGITQPRRVAAVTISHRVAEETRSQFGSLFMTDGILLREAMEDSYLSRYSVIILDEAHERTVRTDVLFGVVKAAQAKRTAGRQVPLKIVIMSATMNVDHFSQYFNNAPVLYIEGRQFTVDVQYLKTPTRDYVYSALVAVFQIHREKSLDGDILVFLTGADEIDAAVRQCRDLCKYLPQGPHSLKAFPLYAALTPQAQLRVFQPRTVNSRRVIFATNIAETSLTIPGVQYVIDCGRVKVRRFEPSHNIDLLRVEHISKEQATQRAGRAGREGPGTCLRLYTETEHNRFIDRLQPEILRLNLTGVVLELLAMGVPEPYNFGFLDPPSTEAMKAAITELRLLGAIKHSCDANNFCTMLRLTNLGRRMAKFPVDPKLAKILLAAGEMGCAEEALTIVSFMATEQSVLISGAQNRDKCELAHRKFTCPEGDQLMMQNVYRAFKHAQGAQQWCMENFIHLKCMETVLSIRTQLRDLCIEHGVVMKSCGNDWDKVRRCLCQGLFLHAAEMEPDGRKYKVLASGANALIHPSSCLFRTSPRFLVYGELLHTSQCYMRTCCVVDGQWLMEAAPEYFASKRLIL